MERKSTDLADMEPSACVATVGVFDGVHVGHQHLIRQVLEEARREQMASLVITFDRLPRQLFDAQFRPQLLTSVEEKGRLIRALGVDCVEVRPFTRELADCSAKDFLCAIYDRLHVRCLVTGYDNRFGKGRSDGFDDYVRYGAEIGMRVLRGDVELTADGNRPFSSSMIRRMLAEEGRVDVMPQYLSRHYQLTGRVVSGEHIGRRIGFPTANLEPLCADKLIPAPGAYAVWMDIGGEVRQAMMNIGTRPTFGGDHQTLEVHILDFDRTIYGQVATVTFVARLRAEQRFDSPEALVRQLEQDKAEVRRLLR